MRILLGSALCLIGCTSKPNYWVNPQRPLIDSPKVHIYIDSAVSISNADDVADDLGAGNPRQVFLDFLNQQMSSEMSFKSKAQILSNANQPLKIQSLVIPDQYTVNCSVPDTALGDSDLILSICNLSVQRIMTSTPGYYLPGYNGMPGTYIPGSTQQFLSLDSWYLLTHPATKTVIAGGAADGQGHFLFKLDQTDWIEATENLSKQFLRGLNYSKPDTSAPGTGLFSK